MSTEGIVPFVCKHCSLPYRATMVPLDEQRSGSFECEERHRLVHEWTGDYGLYDWQPIRGD